MLLYLIGLVQITLATHDLYSLVTCRSCSHVEIQFDWFTVNVTGALGRHFLRSTDADWLTRLINTGATITQFLYAHMIYIISRKLWLSGFIVSVCNEILFSVSQATFTHVNPVIIDSIGLWIPFSCLRWMESYMRHLVDHSTSGVCQSSTPQLPFSSLKVWGPTTIACDVTITLSLSIFLVPINLPSLWRVHITDSCNTFFSKLA